MKLLVSGHESVGLVDWGTGAISTSSMPDCYRFDGAAAVGCPQPIRTFGLTWDESSVFVACHEAVGILDRHLNHTEFLAISPLWLMTHSIAYRAGSLFTCNTRIDVLGVHELESGRERFVHVGAGVEVPNPQHLKPLRDGYAHDRHHPNAVLVSTDHVHVLVHCSDGAELSSEVRLFDRRHLGLCDRILVDRRPLGSPYLHDLALDGDTYLWCDTYRRRVRSSAGAASRPLGDESMFLRGLAVTATHVFAGLASRKDGVAATDRAHIVRLDRSTLTEIDRRAIDFPVEVCALRAVDDYDYAHLNRCRVDLAPP